MFSRKLLNTVKTNPNPKKFDAVIIGGGSGGYTAAIRIAQLGGEACIVEKKCLGGVCANTGCIPTKCLISIAKSFANFKNSEKFGLTAENISYDIQKIKSRLERTIKKAVKGIENLLASNGVEIIKGFGCVNETGKVIVYDNEKKTKVVCILNAKNIVIASGSNPMRPQSIAKNKNIITSEDVFALTDIPKNLVIIGGGYIGLEFASIFNGLGVNVSVIEKLERILPAEEQEISDELARLMQRTGINISTNTDFSDIDLEVDKVLLAMGRQPNLNRQELSNLGVIFSENGIKTDLSMRTNVKGVYAIGDVNGKFLLAYLASAEGIVAAENIMGRKQEMNYNNIPNCIFTIPEVASIGKREGKSGKFPFIANGKAFTMGETDGFVKVYVDDGRLVGASIIGVQASSLIAVAQGLLGKNVEEIKRMIIAHPTLPEAIFEAVLDTEGQAINLLKQ